MFYKFLLINLSMSETVLSPLYSISLPFFSKIIVGKPFTLYLLTKSGCSSALIASNLHPNPLLLIARGNSLSNTGFNFLQCPHQSA